MDEQSLSHSYCTKVPEKGSIWKIEKDIGWILRKLCEYKHVEIIEAYAMPDHIHMLLRILPKLSVSQIMEYLKRKSSLMFFDRYMGGIKSRYRNTSNNN